MNILEKGEEEYNKKIIEKKSEALNWFKKDLQKLLKLNDSQIKKLNFHYREKYWGINIDNIIFIYHCGLRIAKNCDKCEEAILTRWGKIKERNYPLETRNKFFEIFPFNDIVNNTRVLC